VVNLDGCVQEGLFDRVNQATRHALAVNGIDVRRWPGQRCCGALHAHAGDLENARALARVNIAAFEASGADTVCVNAAGCGAALQGYAALLRDDPAWADRARDFGDRVQDVSEVLAGVGPRPGGPIETRVAYDPPCHLLHAQGVDEPVRRLLGAVPGLEVVEVPRGEECCGGAGIYGLTHPRLGGRIGGDKIDAVAGTGAPFVATGNPGCMMQIGAGLLRREISCAVVHPVELLAESYRRAGLGPAPTGPGPGSAPPAPVPPSHPSRQESHGR
jgi:glycolate oxidase iron-sulfur subunit